MHRHRRPGWRRRRPLSDIEAMYRKSAQIVRTELLTPGFVKQRRTAHRLRSCDRLAASNLTFGNRTRQSRAVDRGASLLCERGHVLVQIGGSALDPDALSPGWRG